jgi:hypothetical protein
VFAAVAGAVACEGGDGDYVVVVVVAVGQLCWTAAMATMNWLD